LRDDIRLIITETHHALERKISLLRQFLKLEHDLHNSLKIDFDNEPADILHRIDDIISEINIQDYIISGLNERFRGKTGKQMSVSELQNDEDCDGMIAALSVLRIDEKRIISDISDLRRINVNIMKNLKDDILKDADELQRMGNLEINLSKDLQSGS
jgi:hypothetical protein